MWVKKSKNELQEDQKARNKIVIKYGVWTFIALISLLILKDRFIGTGGLSGAPWEKTISWTEIYENIAFYIGFSALLAIIVYKFNKRIQSDTQICDKCEKKTRKKHQIPNVGEVSLILNY